MINLSSIRSPIALYTKHHNKTVSKLVSLPYPVDGLIILRCLEKSLFNHIHEEISMCARLFTAFEKDKQLLFLIHMNFFCGVHFITIVTLLWLTTKQKFRNI